MKIPFDPEVFPDLQPGETVEVSGVAVLSDDGSELTITEVEGVPIEDEMTENPEEEVPEGEMSLADATAANLGGLDSLMGGAPQQ